jgi:hypothetical protein
VEAQDPEEHFHNERGEELPVDILTGDDATGVEARDIRDRAERTDSSSPTAAADIP